MEDIDYSACAQIANCPVCEGREFRRVGSVPTIHPDSKAEFAVNRCRACGHWHTTPLPSQGYLNALYSSGSLSVIGEGWAKDTQNRSVDTRLLASPDDTSYWIFRAEAGNPAGSYLEFGPGDFSLFRVFENAGWDCFAVEPGSWAHRGDNVVSRIEDLPGDRRFTAIVLNDVLEHMSNPAETLRRVSAMLEVGGRVYLAFPNADSIKARILGVSWRMVRPLGHLHYFSSQSVDRLAQTSGLEVARKEARELVQTTFQGVYGDFARMVYSVITADFARARRLGYKLFSHLCGVLKSGDQWMVVLHKAR